MDRENVLWECLRHFYGLDISNAAMHCAPVQFSPITFRVAEALHELREDGSDKIIYRTGDHAMLDTVLNHKGLYLEDSGR